MSTVIIKRPKKNNDKKAVLYSQAAANYATIYETVCRKGKSH